MIVTGWAEEKVGWTIEKWKAQLNFSFRKNLRVRAITYDLQGSLPHRKWRFTLRASASAGLPEYFDNFGEEEL
jgi:hypothetical protein